VTPEAGTPLIAGSTFTFSVVAIYRNELSQKAQAQLFFPSNDDKPRRMLCGTVAPADGRSGTVELSCTVAIPAGGDQFRAVLLLAPEGIRNYQGAVDIRYPVVRT
jgi:hypothetical protein